MRLLCWILVGIWPAYARIPSEDRLLQGSFLPSHEVAGFGSNIRSTIASALTRKASEAETAAYGFMSIQTIMISIGLIAWAAGVYVFLVRQKNESSGQLKYSNGIKPRRGSYTNSALSAANDSHVKQTNLLATYNVVNMYVGVGFWGLPYSIFVGGYMSLVILGLLLVICTISAIELVRLKTFFSNQESSAYAPESHPGSRQGSRHGSRVGSRSGPATASEETGVYMSLAKQSLGTGGEVVAGMALAGEFIGTSMVLLYTVWDLLARLLKSDFAPVTATTAVLLLPFLWHSHWSNLAYINAFALFATVLAIVVMMYSILENPQHAADNVTESWFTHIPPVSKLVFATGLQMVALGSGTPTIPSILSQTANPRMFNMGVILPSMISVAIFSFVVAMSGILAYGANTEFLLTDNLISDGNFGIIVSAMIVFATFATIPPVLAMTADPFVVIYDKLTQSEVFIRTKVKNVGFRKHRLASRTLRYMVFGMITVSSYFLRNNMGLVLEVIN
ncbi:hypothetical protein AAMO2058_001154000 [Amorphochlora amoebiformis]